MPLTRANGPAIRAIRERSGLSIREVVDLLAEADVTIHPDYLRNIELGHKRGSARVLNALARALHVPLHALLGPSVEPEARTAAASVA
jgi:transcriptional regulator with XRE-family HTH domain